MRMRRSVLLLLAAAACGEPSAVRVSPTDRFVFPATVATTSYRDAQGQDATALLVASGNYDLNYDGATGGTVLSVDPALATDGGSAGRAGGELVPLGAGAHVGSFVGQLAVVDATTCPGTGTASRPPVALVATRFANEIWRLPMGLDGTLGPCSGSDCTASVDARLRDPFGVALACRADGLRRSAFVGYLRSGIGDAGNKTGWLAELDLDDPAAPARVIEVGAAAVSGLAYDDRTDRLFVLGQPLLSAPIFVLDLTTCPDGLAACATPAISAVDLNPLSPGLDLQSIALSNHQDGLTRRAYVSARVYDASLASLLGARPAADADALLLVVDLEERPDGGPSLQVLRWVRIGTGASQVRVLPVRTPAAGGAPRRDVVVVSSTTEGVIAVYDDEQGAVARVVPVDGATGSPEVGRAPYGLAVDPRPVASADGPAARVYVAASQQAVVGIVDVPLDAPGKAHALRDASGALVRIGGLQ